MDIRELFGKEIPMVISNRAKLIVAVYLTAAVLWSLFPPQASVRAVDVKVKIAQLK